MSKIELEDLERIALKEQGIELFEGLFGHNIGYSSVSWEKIESKDFKPGFVIREKNSQLSVSRRKHNSERLLNLLQLNLEDFEENLYCIKSEYDVIYYGYVPNNKQGFILVGKGVAGTTDVYYRESTLANTKTTLQQLEKWLHDYFEKKQNDAAA
jgi:hypothetical protein